MKYGNDDQDEIERVFRDAHRAIHTLIWLVRPDNVRAMTLQEQEIWRSKIMCAISFGEWR